MAHNDSPQEFFATFAVFVIGGGIITTFFFGCWPLIGMLAALFFLAVFINATGPPGK